MQAGIQLASNWRQVRGPVRGAQLESSTTICCGPPLVACSEHSGPKCENYCPPSSPPDCLSFTGRIVALDSDTSRAQIIFTCWPPGQPRVCSSTWRAETRDSDVISPPLTCNSSLPFPLSPQLSPCRPHSRSLPIPISIQSLHLFAPNFNLSFCTLAPGRYVPSAIRLNRNLNNLPRPLSLGPSRSRPPLRLTGMQYVGQLMCSLLLAAN